MIWRNNSQKTHNVKFETEGFNSGRIAPRGAANHDFTVALHLYICTIHDGMTGQIGVYPLLSSGPKRPVGAGHDSWPCTRAPPEGTGEVTIEADTGSGSRPWRWPGRLRRGGHEDHEAPRAGD